jgi:hypothetical protein
MSKFSSNKFLYQNTKALHVCFCRALSCHTPGLLLERVVSCSLNVFSLQRDTTDEASIYQYLYMHLSIAMNEPSTGILVYFRKKWEW